MNSKKRGTVPLFSVFQTEHTFLASTILVIAIILVAISPVFLFLLLIVVVVLGVVGLLAIISGLVDMNREALEYRSTEHTGLISNHHRQTAFADESSFREGNQQVR